MGSAYNMIRMLNHLFEVGNPYPMSQSPITEKGTLPAYEITIELICLERPIKIQITAK